MSITTIDNMICVMEKTLGARLRQARDQRGWTLEYVAGRMRRPLSWYSTLETGRKKGLPEPFELRQIGEILGLSMPELLEAAGYLSPDDLNEPRANPFERDDPRWQYVETLKRFDLTDEYDAFVLVAAAQLLQMIDGDRSLLADPLASLKVPKA